MKILITGGAGFQGSHVAERCAKEGHNVSILNTMSDEAGRNIAALPECVSVVWGSVTDREVVQKTVRGHDVVFHLAARIHVDESIQLPANCLDVNIMGTFNVLEAVRLNDCRMIFASSCEVYGATGSAGVAEDAGLRPHSPYAASKAAADRLCFAYWKSYGTQVTVVRPCNIYGPRQKSGRDGAVIPIFVTKALKGEPLLVYGNGEQRREYMHVEDLVEAYHLVLGKPELAGEAMNFGTGETPSIREIAESISQMSGAKIHYGNGRPGEVAQCKLSSTVAKGLGFAPRVKFLDGLERYFCWRNDSSSG